MQVYNKIRKNPWSDSLTLITVNSFNTKVLFNVNFDVW